MSRLKVTLHPSQLEVARDDHRFRILCAGRRWGKSVLSRLETLRWATEQEGVYWIVSPTYKQAKSIHWRDIQKEVPKQWIQKKNEVELSITLKNGSIIELKGAENPDALRGVKLRGLVVDEIASIRNWSWLWEEVLRPTLTDYRSPAIFISTPKGYNHFYDLFQVGKKDSENYKSWRFTSYDNPTIASEEIDEAKKTLTEDTFAQEYLADFRKHTGLVYKEFDREKHVVKNIDIPDDWSMYRCMDFGSTNPTVCLWVAVDGDDNWWVVDEHYKSGETIDFHAGIINSRTSTPIVTTYGDPSGAQWIDEFSQRGVYITKATREKGTSSQNWVRYKIEKVAEKLKPKVGHTVGPLGDRDPDKGIPSLFIFEHCHNTIQEFETYRWKTKSVSQAQDLNEPDTPEKANDHAMDALSYFACSYKKPAPTPVYLNKNSGNWNIGL
jgi:hypothetical protein